MTTEFTVYGNFNSQPAARVVLFLSMAGVPFAYRHVNLRDKQQKTPEYLAINRFGRVPALRHGDLTISESGVILNHLVGATGRFGGTDAAEWIRLQEWMSWLADVLMPVQRARAFRRFGLDPNARAWVDASAASGLAQLDGHLTERTWIEDDRVTVADIFAFPLIDLLGEAEIDPAAYPAVAAWHGRMLEQPGCRRMYDLMPQEDVG